MTELKTERQEHLHGTGRRKTAVASVRLTPGTGEIIVNGIPYEERFPRAEHRRTILRPFLATDSVKKFNTVIKVSGSGVSGQAGAISHGIAQALGKSDESLRVILRQQGLLTRDSRAKERKKPGLKRARKAPQYTKR